MRNKRSYCISNTKRNPSFDDKLPLEQGLILRDAARDLAKASDRAVPVAGAYVRGLAQMASTTCTGVIRFTFYRNDNYTQVEIFIGGARYYMVRAGRITEVEQ